MPIFRDVPCTVCGCVCDDLTVTIDSEGKISTLGTCSLALPWFEKLNQVPDRPLIEFEQALHRSAEILRNSRRPLIFGLSRSSTQGQREAVHLAEQIGGVIDTTASVCHGPSILAIQNVGESTCTLGEVAQRADLVLFWGADPATSHPRHMERYSAMPTSRFLPLGRENRTVVVIDVAETETVKKADLFLQVEPGSDFELISKIRSQLRFERNPAEPQVLKLLELIVNCRYGAVFFGLGLAQQPNGHLVVESLLRLVAELNSKTRFVARRLRIPGDVTGADSVLCWQTGYPFAVDFSRGFPRYNPGEYSAQDLLESGEVDAALIIGSESLDRVSERARQQLERLPTITLDYPHIEPRVQGTIRFETAVYGLDAPGTAYRMDEIPIPLPQLRERKLPTDDEILRRIREEFSRNVRS